MTVVPGNARVGQAYDIGAKLVELHKSCTPLIKYLVDEGIYRPTTAQEYIHSRANADQRHMRLLVMMAKQSALGIDGAPVDLAHLSDLRAVFDHVWVGVSRNPTKIKGLPEGEFTEVAASILCPTYPNRVAEWFCTVDTAEVGYVDWRVLSQYVIDCSNAISKALAIQFANQVRQEVSPQHSPRANVSEWDGDSSDDGLESSVTGMRSTSSSSKLLEGTGVEESTTLTVTAEPPQYNELCEGRLAHPPGYHVIKVVNHFSGNSIGCCSDGAIRTFNPSTLRAENIIHHADGRNPSSMGLSGNNLFVSDRDGVVLMYDVTGECSRTGNVKRAFRIMSESSVAPLEIVKTVKFDQLKMERPARAVSGAAVPASVQIPLGLVKLNAYAPRHYAGNAVSPLGPIDFGRQLLTAIAPQADCRDPHFFAGFGRGVIAWYTPEYAHTHSVSPAAVFFDHTDQVTQITHCTHNLQLQGLVSSSTDGTINVVDLDKLETKLTFRSTIGDLASTTGGGWVEGKRSFTSFDISHSFPLLAASGTMRYVTLWSGQSRRLVASFADHKDTVVDVKFNDRHRQVISLSKDRTIRVWDLRTMGLLQLITDKERKYTDDPLTALSISDSNNIVAWSGTPFVFPAITGTLALLTQGHPTSHIEVSDCDPLAIAVNQKTLMGVDPTNGATIFEYHAHSPIKSVAHDPSWKRLHVLTEANQLEVVVVGQPRPTKRIDVEHLRLRCITYRPSCNFCAAGLVAGSNLSIYFFTDKSVLGMLMPLHVVVLESLSKNTSRPIRTVTGIATMKNGQIAATTATGEVAVLGMAPNAVNVLFVISGNDRISKVLSLMQLGTPKRQSMKTGHLWTRALEAAKRETTLGASEFTRFRHDGQMQLHRQCDALVPFGDGCHAVVSYGNGDIGVLSVDSSDSVFLCCFPGSYTTGTGVVVAAGGGFILVGDDEGFLSIFRCTIPPKGQSQKLERGSRKYFTSCGLFLVVALRFHFGISALAVSPDGLKAIVGFDCGVIAAVSLSSNRLLWATHDLTCASAKRREHQFIRNFRDISNELHSSVSTAGSCFGSLSSLQGHGAHHYTVASPRAAQLIEVATMPKMPGDTSSSESELDEEDLCEHDDNESSGEGQCDGLASHRSNNVAPPHPRPVPAWKRPASRHFTLRSTISRPGSSQESRLAAIVTHTPPRPATATATELLSAWSERFAPDSATAHAVQQQRGVRERLGDALREANSFQGSSLAAKRRTLIKGGYYHTLPLRAVTVQKPTEDQLTPPIVHSDTTMGGQMSGAEEEDVEGVFERGSLGTAHSRPTTRGGSTQRNPFIRLL